MITFNIAGQELSVSSPVIVSETKKYITASFTFSSDWNDITDKILHYYNGETYYSIPIVNDELTPEDNLQLSNGLWKFYIHGINQNGVRITTTPVFLTVKEFGNFEGELYPDAPQHIVDRLLLLIRTDGDGTLFLANDGTYKGVTVSSQEIAEAVESYLETHPVAAAWGNISGSLENQTDLAEILADLNEAISSIVVPSTLSQLLDDSEHRTVTDTEKTAWNNKQNALVSGTNIKTINGESVLGSGNIAISGGGSSVGIYFAFANDTPSDGLGTIYLFSADGDSLGDYDIMWGDTNGIMNNYSPINTNIEVKLEFAEKFSYSHFNVYNAIPKYATRICAVKDGAIKASHTFPASKLFASGNFGEHLYSVGILADVHYQYNSGSEDWANAFTYLDERENVSAICIAGDLTSSGTKSQLDEWKTARDTYATHKPVYACNGNHETQGASSYMVSTPTDMRKYLDTEYVDETVNYFVKTIGNDIFLFVPIFEGVVQGTSATMFSQNCLAWLQTQLETYRNQRTFIFAHVPPYKTFVPSGFGTGNGAYSFEIWGGSTPQADRTAFLELLAHYKNAIWFSGHSHIKYCYQEEWANLNVARYNADGAKLVHISSLTVPRDIISGHVSSDIYAESEGTIMDVYPNMVILRSRNFVDEKFIGIAQYMLDTTPVVIPPYAPTEKTLVSISATKTKTTYTQNEQFSTSDVTVTATYDDDTTADVTSSATIGTVDTSTTGTKTLSISYTENGVTQTTSISIEVVSGGGTVQVPLTLTDQLKIDSSTGAESTDATYMASQFIPLVSGATYTIRNLLSYPSDPEVKVCYYSANTSDAFISCSSQIVKGTSVTVGEVPNVTNTTHIRLRIYSGFPSHHPDISNGGVTLEYEM